MEVMPRPYIPNLPIPTSQLTGSLGDSFKSYMKIVSKGAEDAKQLESINQYVQVSFL